MGKKKGKRGSVPKLAAHRAVTLQKENSSVSSTLKMQHLQKVAIWASQAGIPSLSALYGRSLAENAEAMGKPLDPSLLLCERCETVFQPGINCTVRIEPNKKKGRRNKSKNNSFQNYVVYTCHFCAHRTIKPGTKKGYMKKLLASRAKPVAETEMPPTNTSSSVISEKESTAEKNLKTNISSGEVSEDFVTPEKDAEAEKSKTPMRTLLSASEKKRKGKALSASKGEQCGSGPSKRRRKGSSSLKELVKSNEQKKMNFSDFAIPFQV